MTVSTVVDHNDYTGNGLTTSFPYTFRIFTKSNLAVTVVDLEENITELVLDTDYTVTGAGGYNGGNVVLTSPLTNGWKISISRELEPTQETDLRNQGKFFAEVHEDALDKLTMLIQQAYSVFRLALRKPSSVANYYDALGNYIRNLRDPLKDQDAATKKYVDGSIGDNTNAWQAGDAVLNSKIDDNFRRTLRVPEISVNMLAPAAQRANKLQAYDNSGQPIYVLPGSGTATDVLIELAKPTGGSMIGMQPKGTLADTQFYVTPKQFGADLTGSFSVNSVLLEMFNSDFSTFVFTKGTYLLTDTLQFTTSKSMRIILEAGATIKLADNVRKNLMVFVGNGANTFEWSGGEIDGNWEGQGPETMTGGNVDDVSHGLIMSKFGTAHVHDLYIHDCMGHHINHGGNKNFIAERINIRAHVSTLKPLGGARGDGITGCSENVTIRDIRGFSTDDLIAVVSGIDWIAGWYPNRMSVKSVLIENIRCETYNYQGVDNYSWNGVSVGNSLGYSTDSVTIRNVSGDTQTRGILVSQEAYGTDYYGDFRKVNISKIALCVHGNPADSFTGKMNTQHITIGRAGMNEVSTSRNYTIYELQISDVQCKASDNSLVAISIGHAQVRAASISNVQCTYDTSTQAMRAIIIVGQKDIPSLTIDNIQQQGTGASPDSVRSQRCAIESYYGATGAMTLTATRLTRLLNTSGNAYIPNTSFVQATGQTKVIPLLYGKDMVCNLDANGTGGISAIPLADGVNFSTPGLGHISYSKIRDAWTFHEFAVQWDTVSYGMPTAANFPNYALFSWKIGTVIPVKGSPYGERKAYLCIGGTPTFSPNDAVTWSSSSALRSSGTSPVSFSPGCVVWAYLPAQTTDAGWAYQNAGMVQYLITDNSTRNGSKRIQYDSSGTSAQRVQAWNGSSWGAWQNLSV